MSDDVKRLLAVAILVSSLPPLLAGCGQAEQGAQPGTSAAEGEGPSLTAEQQAVYDRTCKNCHGRSGSGAPAAGDTRAWAPRIAKGLPTLVDHTINGFKGMPPMGLCTGCSQDQVIAFIEYMAGVECDEDETGVRP